MAADAEDHSGMVEGALAAMRESPLFDSYCGRHGIVAQPNLTVTDDDFADTVASWLEPRVAGKVVVEIGGGIGLFALHLGLRARRVFCIEANPIWAASFTWALMSGKPKNVNYLFGSADEFSGIIRADVAVFLTHSGVDAMRAAASLFAPVVIDVYGELIEARPDAFDRITRELRGIA